MKRLLTGVGLLFVVWSTVTLLYVLVDFPFSHIPDWTAAMFKAMYFATGWISAWVSFYRKETVVRREEIIIRIKDAE